MATPFADAYPWRPKAIYAFADDRERAAALATRLGAAMGDIVTHTFPDDESLITVVPTANLESGPVALYRSLNHPNPKIMDLLLAASALRDNGAAHLTLIAPYLPYMRQDRAFQPGQGISQAVFGRVIGAVFDGILTVQPHLHRSHDLSAICEGRPTLVVSAAGAMARSLAKSVTADTMIAGPDEESAALVREVADELRLPWFVAGKSRGGDKQVRIELPADASVARRPVIILDDIISSGGTIQAFAWALLQAGAWSITVCAAHALYDAAAGAAIAHAGVKRVRSLDGIPHESNDISVVDAIAMGIEGL